MTELDPQPISAAYTTPFAAFFSPTRRSAKAGNCATGGDGHFPLHIAIGEACPVLHHSPIFCRAGASPAALVAICRSSFSIDSAGSGHPLSLQPRCDNKASRGRGVMQQEALCDVKAARSRLQGKANLIFRLSVVSNLGVDKESRLFAGQIARVIVQQHLGAVAIGIECVAAAVRGQRDIV